MKFQVRDSACVLSTYGNVRMHAVIVAFFIILVHRAKIHCFLRFERDVVIRGVVVRRGVRTFEFCQG
jgi:hypothetical protein